MNTIIPLQATQSPFDDFETRVDGPDPLTQVYSNSAPHVTQRSHLEDRSTAFRILFLLVTCMTQLIGQSQFGMVMIPLGDVGTYLNASEQGEESWMAASFGYVLDVLVLGASYEESERGDDC
jgi:hypothetical protein